MLFSVLSGVQAAVNSVISSFSSVVGDVAADQLVVADEKEGGEVVVASMTHRATGAVVRCGVNVVCHMLVWRVLLWYFMSPFSIPGAVLRFAWFLGGA